MITSGVRNCSRFFNRFVPVDDAAIQIVEIACGKPTAFERNERTQIRRNHRQHFKDQPFRAHLRIDESFGELEAFGDLLAYLLALGGIKLVLHS